MIRTRAKRRRGAAWLSREPANEQPPPPLAHHQSLVEQYAAMSHVFAPRPVDLVLRLLDVVIGGCAALLGGPVVILIAVVLKLSSPRGPVLYRGWRVGRGGHLFQMLKFRTLAPDAEERLGPYLGPQLTELTEIEVSRVGRVLRASRLDELPQLYNVLRGEMSLVGPRPIRPRFFEELCVGIPEYWQRLVVRPGITGLAQLRLTREMTWGEKLAHDLEYIADRSVRLYLSVIATTVWLLVARPANRRAVLNRLP
ncbi:MAG: sugar transferase [Solirubrobacterales bacterium]|nr:sugar transferase [Solirubrobacterales bacterium]